MDKTFGCVRFIYNWALARKKHAWETRKLNLSRFDLQRELVGLKQNESTSWLRDVNSQSLQVALKNLDTAYNEFFSKKSDFPRFKNRLSKQTFQCPQLTTIDLDNSTVSIPKIKDIKIRLSRFFEGTIRHSTVKRSSSGKYSISILVEDGKITPDSQNYSESTTIGIDLGLTHFATLSTGEKISNPRYLKKSLNRLRRHQRKVARSLKTSRRRIKKQKKVALIHERVANQRFDFLQKLSTRIIRENQAIALETLNVKGMLKNRRLSRSISDVGWTSFVEMLEYKAQWYGKTILRIGRFEPSSKACSCGVINKNLTMKMRVWTCSSCNITHDRDILAANNIKTFALHPQNRNIGRTTTKFTPEEIYNSESSNRESTSN